MAGVPTCSGKDHGACGNCMGFPGACIGASHIAKMGFPLLMWEVPGGHITGHKNWDTAWISAHIGLQIGESESHCMPSPVEGSMSNNISIYADCIEHHPLPICTGTSSIGCIHAVHGMTCLGNW